MLVDFECPFGWKKNVQSFTLIILGAFFVLPSCQMAAHESPGRPRDAIGRFRQKSTRARSFAGRRWQDLCGEWGFAFDDEDRGLPNAGSRTRPFGRKSWSRYPPESPAVRSGGHRLSPRRLVPARIRLRMIELRGAGLRLHLEPSTIKRRYGSTAVSPSSIRAVIRPFHADIAPLSDDDGPQVIVVRAEDRADDLQQPRGKQYWRERPALHLVSSDHRDLAAGLARAGPADRDCGTALDARRRSRRSPADRSPEPSSARGLARARPPDRRQAAPDFDRRQLHDRA